MQTVVRIFAFLCSVSLFLGITQGCGKGRVTVTAAGSTAFQPFAETLAGQFMAKHPDIVVTVQGGGSAVGIQSALSGAAQIGMADMVQLPPETASLKSVVVAKDGIALVVNPANPVTGITMAQTRNIFNGKITNWKEVGGPDARITVVSREAGSGTRMSFEQIVGGVELTPDSIVQDSNGTIRETVALDSNAIGYLSHGLVNERVKQLTLDNAMATTEEIMSGKYPLFRPVFLMCKPDAAPAVGRFIEYVLSPEGQDTIRKNGLIPAQ
jgi:phosphate transport system substrate-binding protein